MAMMDAVRNKMVPNANIPPKYALKCWKVAIKDSSRLPKTLVAHQKPSPIGLGTAFVTHRGAGAMEDMETKEGDATKVGGWLRRWQE